MSDNTIKISLEGKYEIFLEESGTMKVTRYGMAWRDLTGDKLVLSLVHEIDRLRDIVNEKEKRNDPFGRGNVRTGS